MEVTDQHRSSMLLDPATALPILPNHGIPNGVQGQRLVLVGNREKRAIPAVPALGLFEAANEVFEDGGLVASALSFVSESRVVDGAACGDGRADVDRGGKRCPPTTPEIVILVSLCCS